MPSIGSTVAPAAQIARHGAPAADTSAIAAKLGAAARASHPVGRRLLFAVADIVMLRFESRSSRALDAQRGRVRVTSVTGFQWTR